MEHKDVPYLVYEATQARNERTIKRLIIVVIVAIALMFISNALWLWAWNSYEYVGVEESSVDLSTDGGGDANYIGNNGDIINGKDKDSTSSETSNEKEKP